MPSTLLPFLQWLMDTPLSIAIAENEVLFPWIEAFHVLGVTLVFGSIVLVDLRLLNLGFRDKTIEQFCSQYLPTTWIAFVLSAITGSLLFISNAINYANNFNFVFKMFLLLCAGLNMLIFQSLYGKKLAHWSGSFDLPFLARLGASCSILIWTCIIIFGRLIGFSLVPTLSTS
jgi:hypothetical protein